ncbi:MAG TPA: helix-turn-helix domain-containing protein [Phycisphaerae bacterium]|nr:helix-turn-helix domain-containing protein [Phycisphaerae bacterium]
MARSFDTLVRRTTNKRVRARAEQRTRQLLGEMLLAEIRNHVGMTQGEVARALGIKQPSLSKLEKQPDMQISTLNKIVEVLGGELEVVARFPKGAVRVAPFGTNGSRTRRPGRGPQTRCS